MNPASAPPPRPTGARLVAVALFGAAFGWLEGVVVVYIRSLIGVAQRDALPGADDMMRRFAGLPWLLGTEQSRELSTLIVIAAVAWLAGYRIRSRLGAFLIAFGVWDIAYYLALYALLRWPPSLTTVDVLFLIPPHPWWSQPVWVPVAISCLLIAAGLRLWFGPPRPGR
jgi:hypothetical protein